MAKLNYLEFPADDPERALRFWSVLLDVELTPRSGEEGSGWQSRSPGLPIGVHARGSGPGDTFSLPYFVVDELADALKRVEALGGTVIHPGEKWAICKDSEGSPFGLAHEAVPRVTRSPLDPARGAEVAVRLRALGVRGVLVQAAEHGYITEVKCGMAQCFCPEELGGAWYFESLTDGYSDWNPTHEHFPHSRREGGHRTVDNAVLAHRLCNRIDYSIAIGRSHRRDLERIRKAREAAAGSECVDS